MLNSLERLKVTSRCKGVHWNLYKKSILTLLAAGTSKSKSPRNKEGTLWVYGDSVNVFFAQSLMNGKLCREIFERCNFSYNWIYPVNNVTLARKENDNFDYDNERVLQAFRRVVHSPEMDEKSAVILNFGLHFVESINFANYKNLINGLVDVLEETETQYHSNSTRLKFRGTKIWKTTTAINKEKSSNIHLGHKRFMTQQVKSTVSYDPGRTRGGMGKGGGVTQFGVK